MENQIPNETSGQRMTKAMRTIGTVALVAAGIVFMLQGLKEFSSFERYISFAGLTGTLAFLGLIAGGRMKEAKSARTFLALAAAATPVLFSQLGAMLYSLTGAPTGSIPNALVIIAPSFAAVAVAGVVTTIVMTPILYIGFGSYFRHRASELVVLLLAGSLCLMIPTRDPNFSAVLIAIQALVFLVYSLRIPEREKPTTPWIPMSLALIPLTIVIGRGLFHTPNDFYGSMSFLAVSIFLLRILPLMIVSRAPAPAHRVFGTIAAALSWYFFANSIFAAFPMANDLKILVTFYPPTIGALFLFPKSKPYQNGIAPIFAIAAGILPIMSISYGWGPLSALIHIIMGALILGIGYVYRDARVFASGSILSAAGVLYYATFGAKFLYSAPWISLSVLGMLLILGAAWLEKNRATLLLYTTRWVGRFKPMVLRDSDTK